MSAMSNYPNGFTIRNMPLLSAYPGEVFWVSSTENGGSFTAQSGETVTVVNGIITSAV